MNPQAKFDVPRGVDLAYTKGAQSAKIVGIGQGVVGIEQLLMVKDVRKRGTKVHAKTLIDHDVLLDVEVYVPEGLAAVIANTAVVAIVNSQNRVAEAVIDRLRIRVQRRPVTTRSHAGILGGNDGVIVSRAATTCEREIGFGAVGIRGGDGIRTTVGM
jgi:hypothetical protein